MLGSSARTLPAAAPAVAQTGPLAVPGVQDSAITRQAKGHQYGPWVFLGLVVAYVLWAIIEQHEKVQDAVKPSNIAFSLRNILMVTATVIVGALTLKIALAKLAAWKFPGAAWVLRVVGGALG